MSTPVLEVNNLKTYFFLGENVIPAVDSVGFSVNYGETLGIVGESGSGKSVTALSIMRLIPNPPGKIVGGQILFEGEDLLQKTEEEMRKIRGNKISMIFQEPMTSLNPVYTVGSQIAEAIILHQGLSKKDALKKSTVQAQILELMKDLQRKTGTAVLFITHDLGVINEIADKVVVMYCGRVVECGKKEDILKSPEHPYTKGLLNSIPVIDGPKKPLRPIRGVVPSPNEISHGCRFKSRCDYVMDKCEEEPPLMNIGDRLVRCWLVHNFEK